MAVVTEAKTELEAIENAKNELGTEKIIYKSEEKVTGKIFKSKTYQVTATSYQDLMTEMKEFLKTVIESLHFTVQFETSINDESLNITMYSDKNPLLIGKNGTTLKALETILRAKINLEWGNTPRINLDVENYKEKREESLERLAMRTAREVRDTKVDVALENMNSYERRIIHNKLSNYRGITTESEGEEPNRHIVIRAVKDKNVTPDDEEKTEE